MSMNFHSNDTFLRNMTQTTSIPNQNFTNLFLLLAEISMKFHSKDTFLRNIACNCSIQNHNVRNFRLLLPEIEYEISFK